MTCFFDSLGHPTLNGTWLGQDSVEASFEAFATSLNSAAFEGACAVGLAGKDGYQAEGFYRACSPYQNWIPVAGFDPRQVSDIQQALDDLVAIGYTAIKIHPRFSGLYQDSELLSQVFLAASKRKLVVFYCTYYQGTLAQHPSEDPYYFLLSALKAAPRVKLVLVHGGGVEVLRYAELVRFNENLLLDVSMTLMKYPGSSVDADLQFLCSHFDRRVCLGTDFPEYSHEQVRDRFLKTARAVPKAKMQRVTHSNILNFLD